MTKVYTLMPCRRKQEGGIQKKRRYIMSGLYVRCPTGYIAIGSTTAQTVETHSCEYQEENGASRYN